MRLQWEAVYWRKCSYSYKQWWARVVEQKTTCSTLPSTVTTGFFPCSANATLSRPAVLRRWLLPRMADCFSRLPSHKACLWLFGTVNARPSWRKKRQTDRKHLSVRVCPRTRSRDEEESSQNRLSQQWLCINTQSISPCKQPCKTCARQDHTESPDW